jgi:hypothetical protein
MTTTQHQLQHPDSPTWCIGCGCFDTHIDSDYPCPSPGSNKYDTRIEENYIRLFESLFGKRENV